MHECHITIVLGVACDCITLLDKLKPDIRGQVQFAWSNGAHTLGRMALVGDASACHVDHDVGGQRAKILAECNAPLPPSLHTPERLDQARYGDVTGLIEIDRVEPIKGALERHCQRDRIPKAQSECTTLGSNRNLPICHPRIKKL